MIERHSGHLTPSQQAAAERNRKQVEWENAQVKLEP